jgi:hypothetical protein
MDAMTRDRLRLAVAVVSSALVWLDASPPASAQDAPFSDKVRLRFEADEALGLRLYAMGGPERSPHRKVCTLPCEPDLSPGYYEVQFRRKGLQRSTRRGLHLDDPITYHVTYASRRGVRIAGAIMLVVSAVLATTFGVRGMRLACRESDNPLDHLVSAYGAALYLASAYLIGGIGIPAGIIMAFVPDKARMVPAQ